MPLLLAACADALAADRPVMSRPSQAGRFSGPPSLLLWLLLAAATSASAAPFAVEPHGPAPAGATALVAQVRDRAAGMVSTAMNYLGVRYRRGGDSAEDGFDCSGFTRQVFEASLGRVLPRRADEQARAPGMAPIGREALEPGDLVFFNTLRRTFSHVGIYLGEGKFIHAPRPGGQVRVEDMRFVYWAKRFTGARRAEVQTAALGRPHMPAVTGSGSPAATVPSPVPAADPPEFAVDPGSH